MIRQPNARATRSPTYFLKRTHGMPCARGLARAVQDSECVAEKRCETRIGDTKTKEKTLIVAPGKHVFLALLVSVKHVL